MARFYAMSLETSLFGDVILVRRWGRIGAHGQVRSEWFDTPDAAAERMAVIASLKSRRGYECYFTGLHLDTAPVLEGLCCNP
jgi:predicted DNA-binding WGR domain protein